MDRNAWNGTLNNNEIPATKRLNLGRNLQTNLPKMFLHTKNTIPKQQK